MLMKNAVVYKVHCTTDIVLYAKYIIMYCKSSFVVVCIYVNYIFYQYMNTQVHQNIGVCEVSHTYLLGCLRYGEKHTKYILVSCGCMLLFTNM